MVRYNGVTRGGVRLDATNIGNGAAGAVILTYTVRAPSNMFLVF